MEERIDVKRSKSMKIALIIALVCCIIAGFIWCFCVGHHLGKLKGREEEIDREVKNKRTDE